MSPSDSTNPSPRTPEFEYEQHARHSAILTVVAAVAEAVAAPTDQFPALRRAFADMAAEFRHEPVLPTDVLPVLAVMVNTLKNALMMPGSPHADTPAPLHGQPAQDIVHAALADVSGLSESAKRVAAIVAEHDDQDALLFALTDHLRGDRDSAGGAFELLARLMPTVAKRFDRLGFDESWRRWHVMAVLWASLLPIDTTP